MLKRFHRTQTTLIAVLTIAGMGGSAAGASDAVLGTDIALRGLVFDQGRLRPGPHELSIVARDRSIDVVVSGIRLDSLALIDPAKIADPVAEPPPYEKPDNVELLDGSGYTVYLDRLLEFGRATVGDDRALDGVEAHVRQSELVVRYERLADGLLLFDKNGTPYFVGEQPLVRPSPMPRSEVEALAERILEAYRRLLEGGGAILHFDDVDLFVPAERVVDTLIPSLEVLENPSATPETKRRLLSNLWRGSPIVEPFLAGHRSSPELRVILDHSRKMR